MYKVCITFVRSYLNIPILLDINLECSFNVPLTMHLSITPVNNKLDAQLLYNTFITVLYMFRAT